jgi:putative transcriptional regulator
MTKPAFARIAEGLDEALRIARGKAKPARLHIPEVIDVRRIRTGLAMSQEDFAAAFGFTLNQVRDWEQRRSRPLGGVRAYLLMIGTDADAVLKILRTPKRKAA